MRFFSIIVTLGFVLAGPVNASEKQFINSWKNYDEQLTMNDDSRLQYRKKTELNFDFLRKYEGQIMKPGEIEAETGPAFLLYSQQNSTILLVAPKNTMAAMKTFNEEYVMAMKQCAQDRSWIVVLPENQWSKIDLNPYCTMDYEEDQITIDLYWADSSSRPLIDVVTSSLSCVPHHLYRWDRRKHEYVLEAKKCTGRRSVQSYTTTDWRVLSRFPEMPAH